MYVRLFKSPWYCFDVCHMYMSFLVKGQCLRNPPEFYVAFRRRDCYLSYLQTQLSCYFFIWPPVLPLCKLMYFQEWCYVWPHKTLCAFIPHLASSWIFSNFSAGCQLFILFFLPVSLDILQLSFCKSTIFTTLVHSGMSWIFFAFRPVVVCSAKATVPACFQWFI